jgi:N-acetyl-gamma-glutamyl-phosphate reductase
VIRVGIIGATGYTGVELINYLAFHRKARISYLGSESHRGELISDVFPHLLSIVDMRCEAPDPGEVAKRSDVVFICRGHGDSMKIVPELLSLGVRVVDFGADFRLKDPGEYERWYGIRHEAPELLETAVYGLPEVNRSMIADASLVANPGCYPTVVILSLAPLLSNGIVETSGISVCSMSGVSGAGRSPTQTTHFCECDENVEAYRVADHRHVPEMEQELSRIAGARVSVDFVPHLLPMRRGIFTTIYARLKNDVADLPALYKDFYKGRAFVRILGPGKGVEVRNVVGTNFCDISVYRGRSEGSVIITGAIDNLGKGAAGQAVQNMNIMFGMEEGEGLMHLARPF